MEWEKIKWFCNEIVLNHAWSHVESRSSTGRRNISGKYRAGVERDSITRAGARRISAYYG